MGEKEKHIEYYPNGKKREEGTYKDGKRDGLITTWYRYGEKKTEGTYKDGELVEYGFVDELDDEFDKPLPLMGITNAGDRVPYGDNINEYLNQDDDDYVIGLDEPM